MQNIYIAFSDSFVADAFLNYLKNIFENIVLVDNSIDITNQNIVITDFNFFHENSEHLKKANIILLLDDNEKFINIKNDLININTLDLPIKMQDLIDTIEQIKISMTKIYSYNQLCLDLNHNILYNDAITLNLSDKEALILKEFFINQSKNSGKSITKEHFMRSVWNISNMEIESQSLESYISVLRRKFNDSNINLVITKNKDGYLIS